MSYNNDSSKNNDNQPFSTKPNPNFKIRLKKTPTNSVKKSRATVTTSTISSLSASSSSSSSIIKKTAPSKKPHIQEHVEKIDLTIQKKQQKQQSQSKPEIQTNTAHDPPTLSGKPRIRRYHSKSRNGCLTCKEAHVKCDETHPICNVCMVKNRHCVYATLKNKTSIKDYNNSQSRQIRDMSSSLVVDPAVPNISITQNYYFNQPIITYVQPPQDQQQQQQQQQQASFPVIPNQQWNYNSNNEIGNLSMPSQVINDTNAQLLQQQQQQQQQYPEISLPLNNVRNTLQYHTPVQPDNSHNNTQSYIQTPNVVNTPAYIDRPISNIGSNWAFDRTTTTISTIVPPPPPPPPPSLSVTSLSSVDPANPVQIEVLQAPIPAVNVDQQQQQQNQTLIPSTTATTTTFNFTQSGLVNNGGGFSNFGTGAIIPMPTKLEIENFSQSYTIKKHSKPLQEFPKYIKIEEEEIIDWPDYNNNDRLEQQKQQEQYIYEKDAGTRLCRSPRNSPRLHFQAGLPYDSIIAFFQAHAVGLLSQQEPGHVFLWRYVIPQLAFNNPLLSNAIIAYASSRMMRRIVETQGMSMCRRPMQRLQSIFLNAMKRYPSIKFPLITKEGLEESLYGSRSCSNKLIVSDKLYDDTHLSSEAKTVLQKYTGTPEQANSTYKKLQELGMFSYGCALKQMAKSISNISLNCVENYFASILIFSYCMGEGTSLVSDWTVYHSQFNKGGPLAGPEIGNIGFSGYSENHAQFDNNPGDNSQGYNDTAVHNVDDNDDDDDNDKEEEEEENFSKYSADDPDMGNSELLPDLFQIFKNTYTLIAETRVLVCRGHPDMSLHSAAPYFLYTIKSFHAMDVFNNKMLLHYVPLLKQVVHMYKGKTGLCDELSGVCNVFASDYVPDNDEVKKEDIRILDKILRRALPRVPIGQENQQENPQLGIVHLDDGTISHKTTTTTTTQCEKEEEFSSYEDGEFLQFRTDDWMCEKAYEGLSPMQLHHKDMDYRDPFYLYPGELEACLLSLVVSMHMLLYSEKTQNIMLLWAAFRDIPEDFVNCARKNRPFALLILISMASINECTQWFVDYNFLKHSSLISSRLPPEWLPGLQRTLGLFEKEVSQTLAQDVWMQAIYEGRKSWNRNF